MLDLKVKAGRSSPGPNGETDMTKNQLKAAILELNAEANGLDKLNKADLELALAALQAQPKPEQANDDQPRKAMGALVEARKGYVSLDRKDGGKSLGCGDPVQQALLAYGPADLKNLSKLADSLLGLCKANKVKPEQTHWDRYGHLNNGQIRMNVGNKLRAAVKSGAIQVADLA